MWIKNKMLMWYEENFRCEWMRWIRWMWIKNEMLMWCEENFWDANSINRITYFDSINKCQCNRVLFDSINRCQRNQKIMLS